jgi:2-dehydro-3-deoxyphosphooctonate aldolase (KDO 8-P synthase)
VPLAKAAICMGTNGLFFEIHPDPDNALCDGPNSISTKTFSDELPKLLDLVQSTQIQS